MKIRILSASDVFAALPMDKAIVAMKSAFGQFSEKAATVPLRTRVETEKGNTLLMPAFMHQSRAFGIKIVSVFPHNPTLGLPTVSASVLVLDPDTGLPKAFMDGGSLTALRTGAAGGLAADLLCRKKAKVMTLFGAGIQAKTQLSAVLAVRPIERVNIVDIDRRAAEKFVDALNTDPGIPEIRIMTDADEAVRVADIVACATTATSPVFNGRLLKPGTHVTGVGAYTPQMREIDAYTVKKARIIVDSREACLAEAGDLIIPGADIDAEIGEIVNGDHPGRLDDTEITFFKSVGIAVQDAVAAGAVLAAAEKTDLGTMVDLGK